MLPSPTMGPDDIKQKIDGREAESNLSLARRLFALFGKGAGAGGRQWLPGV